MVRITYFVPGTITGIEQDLARGWPPGDLTGEYLV